MRRRSCWWNASDELQRRDRGGRAALLKSALGAETSRPQLCRAKPDDRAMSVHKRWPPLGRGASHPVLSDIDLAAPFFALLAIKKIP